MLWDELTQNSTVKQFKRTPAVTGFKAGWKSFIILNIHLHPCNKDADRAIRLEEIKLLLEAIDEKQRKGHLWNENIVILGDTNLYKNNTSMVQLFTDNHFEESEELKGKYTNVSETEIYDRIFLRVNEYFEPITDMRGESKGDVFPIFDYVFTQNEISDYKAVMLTHKEDPSTLKDDAAFKKYYHLHWKRAQISDHNPVWIEVDIDSSNQFLEDKLKDIK